MSADRGNQQKPYYSLSSSHRLPPPFCIMPGVGSVAGTLSAMPPMIPPSTYLPTMPPVPPSPHDMLKAGTPAFAERNTLTLQTLAAMMSRAASQQERAPSTAASPQHISSSVDDVPQVVPVPASVPAFPHDDSNQRELRQVTHTHTRALTPGTSLH